MIATQDPQQQAPERQGPLPIPTDEPLWFQFVTATLQDHQQMPEEEFRRLIEGQLQIVKRTYDERDARREMAHQRQAGVEQQVDQGLAQQDVALEGEQLGHQIRLAGERMPDMRPGFESQLRVLASQGLDQGVQKQLVETMDRISAGRSMIRDVEGRLRQALEQSMAGEQPVGLKPDLSPMGAARTGLGMLKDVGAGLAKGATAGALGETSFRGRSIESMLRAARDLEREYYPRTDVPGYQQALMSRGLMREAPSKAPEGMPPEMFRSFVADTIGKIVAEKVAPAEPQFAAKDFAQEVGNLLGWAVPFKVATLPMKAAMKGGKMSKGMQTALSEFASPTVAFTMHGYVAEPSAEDKLRIEQAGSQKESVEEAIRIRNATLQGATAPLYFLMGAGKGAPVLKGLGIGAAAPAITEGTEAALDAAAKAGVAPESVRDFYAAQGHYGAIDRVVNAKDSQEAWAAAKDYAKQAGVGMIAFGSLGMMQRLGQRFGGRDELMARRREVEAELAAKVPDEAVRAELQKEADAIMEAIAPSPEQEAKRVAEKQAAEHGITRQDVNERVLADMFPAIEGATLREKRDTVAEKIDALGDDRRTLNERDALEAEWEAMSALQQGDLARATTLIEQAKQSRAAKPGEPAPTVTEVEPAQVEATKLSAEMAVETKGVKAIEAEVGERTGKWKIVAADPARDLITLEGPDGTKTLVRRATLESPKWEGRVEGEIPPDPELPAVRALAQELGTTPTVSLMIDRLGYSAGRARRLVADLQREQAAPKPSEVAPEAAPAKPALDESAAVTDKAIAESKPKPTEEEVRVAQEDLEPPAEAAPATPAAPGAAPTGKWVKGEFTPRGPEGDRPPVEAQLLGEFALHPDEQTGLPTLSHRPTGFSIVGGATAPKFRSKTALKALAKGLDEAAREQGWDFRSTDPKVLQAKTGIAHVYQDWVDAIKSGQQKGWSWASAREDVLAKMKKQPRFKPSEGGSLFVPSFQDMVAASRVTAKVVRDVFTRASKRRMDTITEAVRRPMKITHSWLDDLKSAVGDFGDTALSLYESVNRIERDIRVGDRIVKEFHRIVGEDSAHNDRLREMLESRHDDDATRQKKGVADLWKNATDDDRKLVRDVDAYLREYGAALAERHPDAIRARLTLEFLGEDSKAARAEHTSKAKALAKWQQANPEPPKKDPAHKGWKKESLRQQRIVKGAEKSVKLVDRQTAQARERLDKLLGAHQRPNYLPHVSIEPDAERLPRRGQNAYDILNLLDAEPAFKVSQHLLPRKGGLEAGGKRDPDVGRSLYHYFHSTIPQMHRADWLVKHEGAIWGERRPMTAIERATGTSEPTFARFDPKHPDAITRVHWHGLFYEVRDPQSGKLYYQWRAPTKEQRKAGHKIVRRVALVDSRGEQKRLSSKQFLREVQEPGNVGARNKFIQAYVPGYAQHRVFVRSGGLLSALTAGGNKTRANRLIRWMNDVLHQDMEIAGGREQPLAQIKLPFFKYKTDIPTIGQFGRQLSLRLRRAAISLMLGGYNPYSASRQLVGALIGNAQALGFRQSIAGLEMPIEYANFVRRAMGANLFGKLKKGTRMWDLLMEGPERVPLGEGGGVRLTGIEQRVRATEGGVANRVREALDAATSMRTGEHSKEAMVDWFLDPLNQSRDIVTGNQNLPRFREKGKRLTSRLAGARQWIPFVGEGEFIGFTGADRFAKTHLYLNAHVQARRNGYSRDEARAIAQAMVIDRHGTQHEIMRSPLMRHPFGALMFSLSNWMQSQVGSNIRTLLGRRGARAGTPESMREFVPDIDNQALRRFGRGIQHQAGMAVSMMGAVVLAKNFLGADWTRQGGATISQAPGGGEDLDQELRGVAAAAPLGRPLIESRNRDELADWLDHFEGLGSIGNKLSRSAGDMVRIFGGDLSKWPQEIPLPFFPGSHTAPNLELAQNLIDFVQARFRDDEAAQDKAADKAARYAITWPVRAYRRAYQTTPSQDRPGYFQTHQIRTGRVTGEVHGEGMPRLLADLLGADVEEQASWVRGRAERQVEREMVTRDRNASREVQIAINRFLQAQRDGRDENALEPIRQEARTAARQWAEITGREDPHEVRAMTNRLLRAGAHEGVTYEEREIYNAATKEIRAGRFARALPHIPKSQGERIANELGGKNGFKAWVLGLPERAAVPLVSAWRAAQERWQEEAGAAKRAKRPAVTSR